MALTYPATLPPKTLVLRAGGVTVDLRDVMVRMDAGIRRSWSPGDGETYESTGLKTIEVTSLQNDFVMLAYNLKYGDEVSVNGSLFFVFGKDVTVGLQPFDSRGKLCLTNRM